MKLYNIKAFSLFTILSLEFTLCEDKIGFAFELTRHGARAPVIDDQPGLFQVATGMLTA